MFQKNLLSIASTAILGMAVAGAAEAITLTKDPVDYGGTGTDPAGWQSLGWEARGRAGTPGVTQFVLRQDLTDPPAKQPDGTNAEAFWTWVSGQEVFWFVDWDKGNNKVTFEIGGSSTRNSNNNINRSCNGSNINCLFVFDQTSPAIGEFTNFSLETLVRTDSPSVGTGTTMELTVNTVNGVLVDSIDSVAKGSNTRAAINPNDPSLPIADITKFYFFSDTPITSLSGSVKMSWGGTDPNPRTNNANERVTFKIEGGNTLVQSIPPQSVPEPTSPLSFLAVCAVLVGTATALKKNQSP